MNVSRHPYQAGPVAWAGIIASTCLVLFFFQKILWLVVPFVLALIIYYVLLPLKLRLVLQGISHDTAAGLVSAGAFSLLALTLVFGLPGLLAEAVGHPDQKLTRSTIAGLSALLAEGPGLLPGLILYGPLAGEDA